MTDSPALHPLHSNRSSPAFRHKIHWLHAWLPLIRSDGRKLARQSGFNRSRPKIPEAAMLRISASQQYGRETSSGQGISNTARGFACRRGQSNSTARLRPVQDASINREHGHFPTAAFRWRSIPPVRINGRPHW
jgi:hypothetical protein